MRPVLVQGIIDCLFEDEKGLILVDYKTDGITDRFKGGFEEARPILEKRYKVQIDLYTKAIEQIYKRTSCGTILVFLRWCPYIEIGKINKKTGKGILNSPYRFFKLIFQRLVGRLN